jgi:hypothetical protein
VAAGGAEVAERVEKTGGSCSRARQRVSRQIYSRAIFTTVTVFVVPVPRGGGGVRGAEWSDAKRQGPACQRAVLIRAAVV